MVTAPNAEAGKGRLGCLLFVLVVVVALYWGIAFIQVRYRFYQMQDEVSNDATFAPTLSDQVIRDRLVAKADSLGLPLGPKMWTIRRESSPSKDIMIYSAYDDSVVINLPGWTKVFRFRFEPQARAPL